MRLHAWLTLVGVLPGVLMGCRQDPTIVVPPSFERPGAVAFFCFDTATRAVVPLSECEGLSGTTTETKALTALVAQTARGEVAAVDLRLDRVIDADVRVPGFTFVQVGEVPSGIVVPPNDPSVTYVASFGSRRIEYYPTSDFREDVDAVGGSGRGTIPLPDGPVDMVLSSAGDALFAALPEMNAIAVLPIEANLSLSTVELVTLAHPDPFPTLVASPASGGAYQRVCPATLEVRTPTSASPTAVEPDPGAEPQPTRLFVDGDTLLVTDAASPLIHRFQITGTTLAALDPITPGVPIVDLAITPVVPATVGGDVATEPSRFLYAIDATDGSVLVLDYQEGSASFGAVLPVHSGDGRWDRVRLLEQARSLDVMTPGFPGAECDPASVDLTDEDSVGDLTPDTLEGVFVAVGLANGLVEVIDIHDLNVSCRGGASCTNPFQDQDERVFIRRHAARIGSFVTVASAAIGTPTFSFEGAPGRLEPDGTAGGGGPGLATLDGCPAFLDPIFPADSLEGGDGLPPLICSVVEPWSSRQQRWDATWEGIIPGAVSGLAHATSPTEITVERGGLCRRGVLGANDVTASMLQPDDPEARYGGDQVFITTDPPESVAGDPNCARFFADEEGVRTEIGLPVLEARNDGLVVDDPEGVLACFMGGDGFSTIFGVELRVRQAFAVVGIGSGFVHRVVADAEGRCRVDRDGQPLVLDDPTTYRNARAYNEQLYVNPFVAFTINNAAGLRNEDAIFSFAVGTVPPVLVADVGQRGTGRLSTIVDQVQYSPTDQRLYVVDSNADGFVQYELDPFQREQTFE